MAKAETHSTGNILKIESSVFVLCLLMANVLILTEIAANLLLNLARP